MNKHTPGPWKLSEKHVLEREVRIREHLAIQPEHGPTFVFLPLGQGAREDLQRANALLLLEAPNLLEALKAIAHRTGDIEVPEAVARDTMRGLWEIATAAIAKAEGREP